MRNKDLIYLFSPHYTLRLYKQNICSLIESNRKDLQSYYIIITCSPYSLMQKEKYICYISQSKNQISELGVYLRFCNYNS